MNYRFWNKKKKEPMCNVHKKRLAPFGMAYFVPRWRGESLEWYDKYMDRLNVNRFSRYELKNMNYGTMTIRHFEYDTYCKDIPFTYMEEDIINKLKE